MKRFSLFLLTLISLSAWGQRCVSISATLPDGIELSFSVPDKVDIDTVSIFGSRFCTISLLGFVSDASVGQPELPFLVEFLDVPVCGRVEVEILYEECIVLNGDSLGLVFPVLPHQPSLCKTDSRNSQRLFLDSALYAADTFSSSDLISVQVLGVARDRRLAQLTLSPLRYNPVTNQLIFYTNVRARITFHDIDHDATKALSLHHSPAFTMGLEPLNDLHHSASHSIKQSGNQAIKIVLVSHPMFRETLAGFVRWKRSIGYLVDTLFTDSPLVGSTATSIASCLRRQYLSATPDNPAPTYLILVGDTAQLPTFQYSYYMGYYGYVDHVSDLNYACLSPDDNLPDCYCGRLSAQFPAQLQAQLDKILLYEQCRFPDPSFLDRAVLVAGTDGGMLGDHGYVHADPAMDYAALLYLNANHGFTSVYEFKNNPSIRPHAPNVSVASNASYNAQTIRDLYSSGVALVNYSAHGNYNGWHSPQFNNEQVPLMTNDSMCGVMIGNCCLTAKFDEPVCFAEALMRADRCRGAVAYIGGSNSTYWDEDFYWAVGYRPYISAAMDHAYQPAFLGVYDRLFHSHGEDRSQWAVTLGSMLMAGNMSVQKHSRDLRNYYWQIYHLFGDPSMMPWLSQPSDMPLAYSGAESGSTSLEVTTDPYAYVAVTDSNLSLVAAAVADGQGYASLTLSEPLDPLSFRLSSIGQNRRPRILTLDQPSCLGNSQPSTFNSQLLIHPNPTSGMLSVESPIEADALLFNVGGRVVMHLTLHAGLNTLDFSMLPQGVYYLKPSTAPAKKIVKL